MGFLIGRGEREREGGDERKRREGMSIASAGARFRLSLDADGLVLIEPRLSPCFPPVLPPFFAPSHLLGRALTFFQTLSKNSIKKQNRLPSGRCVREEFAREKKTREKRLGPLLFFKLESKALVLSLSLWSFALSLFLFSLPFTLAQRLARLFFVSSTTTIFQKIQPARFSLSPAVAHSPLSHHFLLLLLLPTIKISPTLKLSKLSGRGGRPLQRPRALGQALGRRAPLCLARAGLLRGLGRRRAREPRVEVHERGADPGGARVLRLPDGDREHPLWYEKKRLFLLFVF